MEWDLLMGAGFSLLAQLPVIVIWTVVLVVGLRMVKRNGGTAEKFIAAGGGIKLGAIFLSVALQYSGISVFLASGGTDTYTAISEIFRWVLDGISVAGFLCFFYAFWLKSTTNQESSFDMPDSPRKHSHSIPDYPITRDS